MSQCCKPLRANVTLWARLAFFPASLFLAAGIWAKEVLDPVKDNLECIVDHYTTLKDTQTNFTASDDATADIDDNVIDGLNKGLDNWDAGVYALGLLPMGFLILSAIAAFLFLKTSKPKCWRYTSKWLIFFTNILLVLAFLFFGTLLVAGIFSQNAQGKKRWEEQIQDSCDDNQSQFDQDIADAEAEVAAQTPGTTGYDRAVADLADAKESDKEFDELCTCVRDMLGLLKPLLGPAIIGVFAFFCAIVKINALCCSMSCCSEPACDMQDMTVNLHGGHELGRGESKELKYIQP